MSILSTSNPTLSSNRHWIIRMRSDVHSRILQVWICSELIFEFSYFILILWKCLFRFIIKLSLQVPKTSKFKELRNKPLKRLKRIKQARLIRFKGLFLNSLNLLVFGTCKDSLMINLNNSQFKAEKLNCQFERFGSVNTGGWENKRIDLFADHQNLE